MKTMHSELISLYKIVVVRNCGPKIVKLAKCHSAYSVCRRSSAECVPINFLSFTFTTRFRLTNFLPPIPTHRTVFQQIEVIRIGERKPWLLFEIVCDCIAVDRFCSPTSCNMVHSDSLSEHGPLDGRSDRAMDTLLNIHSVFAGYAP